MAITFSVIIPIKPNIKVKALESLKNIDYAHDCWEVIVVEGTQPSVQRNKAVNNAKGEIIFFLDDDSEVIPQLFNSVLEFYRDDKVAVVGGPALIKSTEKGLGKAIALVLKSYFGTFNTHSRWFMAGNKPKEATEKNLIMCNMSIRKEIFLKEGGLNETLYPNEENEFLHRLKKRGYKLVYNPQTIIYREHHKRIQDFIKTIFRYGSGRAKQNFINPTIKDIAHTIPLIFSIYLLTLILIHSFLWYLPAIVYVVLNLLTSGLIVYKEKDIKYIFLIPFLFLLLHLSYGLGLGFGLITGMYKKSLTPQVNIKIVKHFGAYPN